MENIFKNYHFCIAWNWKGDSDFIFLIAELCQKHNLNFLEINPENLEERLKLLKEKKITFNILLDRASDTDERFGPLGDWAKENNTYIINAYELSKRAADKSIMHYEFINNGLHTPYTFILPPYNTAPEIKETDISILGKGFNIKPACGGGGEGVVMEVDSWEKVLSARKQFPDDKYLLQANIVPKKINSYSFWFRVIYCLGQIYPFWWDRATHVYTEVTSEEEEKYTLASLRKITFTISQICKLELFSTEIALTNDNVFVVIDYVNDQIDLRLKSKNTDGVPDQIVHRIVEQIMLLVIRKSNLVDDKADEVQP